MTGTMADVLNGSPLALEACDEETGDPVDIDLEAGEHRLHARRPRTSRSSTCWRSGAPRRRRDPPRVRIERWGRSERTAVVAAGDEALLSLPENFNDGWVAEVDGEELTPVRVDGWQQGWILPAGEQVTVELRYRPQTTYDVILPLGLVVSGSLLLGALVFGLIGLVRPLRAPAPSRRRRAVPWPPAEPPDRIVSAVPVGGALLLLGPAATIGLVAGAVCSARRALAGGRGRRWADRAVRPARRARPAGVARRARRPRRRARGRAAGRPRLVAGTPLPRGAR